MVLARCSSEDFISGNYDPDGGPTEILAEPPQFDDSVCVDELRPEEPLFTLVSLNARTTSTVDFHRSSFQGGNAEISCGRDHSNTIVLQDPRVSSKHFTIRGKLLRRGDSRGSDGRINERSPDEERSGAPCRVDAASSSSANVREFGETVAINSGNEQHVVDGRNDVALVQLEILNESSNGTWLNDQPIEKEKWVPLRAGDRVFVLPSARVTAEASIGYAIVLAGEAASSTVSEQNQQVAQASVQITGIIHPVCAAEVGRYFFFNAVDWSAMVGKRYWSGNVFSIAQSRDGRLIWSGDVMLWDNHNGSHGRRKFGADRGQWQIGDIVALQAGLPPKVGHWETPIEVSKTYLQGKAAALQKCLSCGDGDAAAAEARHCEQLVSLRCRLCGEAPVHRCATTVPCGHNFDLGCLLAWRHGNRNCPVCGAALRQIVRNCGVDRMVETFLASRPKGAGRAESTLKLLDNSEKDSRNSLVLSRLLHGVPVPDGMQFHGEELQIPENASAELPLHLAHLAPFTTPHDSSDGQGYRGDVTPRRDGSRGGNDARRGPSSDVRRGPPLAQQLAATSVACVVS